jgi:hypothetical protein
MGTAVGTAVGLAVGVTTGLGDAVGDGLAVGETLGEAPADPSDGPAEVEEDAPADEVDEGLGLPVGELQAARTRAASRVATRPRIGSRVARISPQTTPASAGRLRPPPDRAAPAGWGTVAPETDDDHPIDPQARRRVGTLGR